MNRSIPVSTGRARLAPLRPTVSILLGAATAALLATACEAQNSKQSAPGGGGAQAAVLNTIHARPGETVTQLVNRAVAGQTVVLPAGSLGPLTIRAKRFAKPIVIDASRAELRSIVIRDSSGINFSGGKVVGPGSDGYGVHIVSSQKIEVRGMAISAVARAMVVHKSSDIRVVGNRFHDLRSDGLTIATSWRVAAVGNSCSNFNPIPKVFDAGGNLVKDGDHPDCIQAWSEAGTVPVSDLQIIGNVAYGTMQGIFLGNGVGYPGFDRVTIADNKMTVTYPHGIYIADGRNSTVVRNVVNSVPNAQIFMRTGWRPARANMSMIRNTPTRFCGNSVPDVPNAPGQKPC